MEGLTSVIVLEGEPWDGYHFIARLIERDGRWGVMKITKTSRVFSVYHLFLNCEEVSYQEFILNFGVNQHTSLRDRERKAFVPVTLERFPLEEQENKTRQKYLEKLRRLCVLMLRMSGEDDEDGMDKVALYREILPGVSDHTRQGDFKELEMLGYSAWFSQEWPDEPGRWSTA